MEQKNNTLLFYTLLYFVFLYLPVLFLPLFSFNDADYMSFPLSGFTTEHYEECGEVEIYIKHFGQRLK